MGDTKGGAFDIDGRLARAWLAEPLNPNGRPSSDVLSPWINGLDLTRRPRDMWIIDFGWTMGEGEASLYEAPFQHALSKHQAVPGFNSRVDTQGDGGCTKDLAPRCGRRWQARETVMAGLVPAIHVLAPLVKAWMSAQGRA